LEEKVGYVWTVHTHNQWKKEYPKGGWVDRLLEGYKGQIDAMERYIGSRGAIRGSGRKYTRSFVDDGVGGEEVVEEQHDDVTAESEDDVDEPISVE
jgi:hypothetical protein